MKKLEQILIVDDEKSNIEPLMAMLTKKGINPDYVETIREGIDHIKEQDYDLVIMDNDFYTAEEGNTCGFYGIDMIRMITGLDNKKLAEKEFGTDYNRIKKQYKDKFILFSGSARRLIKENPELFEGIDVCIKYPDMDNNFCEMQVLDIMKEKGIDVNGAEEFISDYKNKNNLKDGINYELMVKDFFNEIGFAKEYLEYEM